MTTNTQQPKIGMIVEVYGIECEIVKIWPLGTIDVVSLDGDKAYRVSGLSFISNKENSHV